MYISNVLMGVGLRGLAPGYFFFSCLFSNGKSQDKTLHFGDCLTSDALETAIIISSLYHSSHCPLSHTIDLMFG